MNLPRAVGSLVGIRAPVAPSFGTSPLNTPFADTELLNELVANLSSYCDRLGGEVDPCGFRGDFIGWALSCRTLGRPGWPPNLSALA